MLVTIVMGTNILYQALRSNSGASFFILKLIRSRKIRLALSIPVFTEYQDVLSRKTSLKGFAFKIEDVNKILIFISYISVPYNISFISRPNLRDEEDNKFVELALVANARYLISSNIKDFHHDKNLSFPDLQIITPGDFVKKWREENEK
ncbi:MAG: putative toxin-antitoxin system toxin component, PIN family [Leptospirales bacterium]